MTLQFAYPTEVTRPYMPDPQKIHDAFKKDLEAVRHQGRCRHQAVERRLPGRRQRGQVRRLAARLDR
jgi:hypothetical protein